MPERTKRDAENSIGRAFLDHHREHHEAYSIKACFEKPCVDILPEGIDLLDEWSDSP